MRNITKGLVATFVTVLAFSINISPANAFAGTLENGNLAYAAGSGFDKGEACNYLPGFETGYDAWHFVLTTRGATFQQDPRNPAVAINLNFVFMRQDGSLFVIRSGAWVQTGKGAYTYTPVADRIRMVQAGTLALINGSDSGMRLSHTCPGSGSITPPTTPTASPSPTTSPTPTSTPRPTTSSTPSPSVSASPTSTASPSASASPSPTNSPSPSVSPSPSQSPSQTPTATPTPSSTIIPTLAPRPSARASAVQIRPTSRPNALPTPTPTPQGITETPSPSPSPSPTPTRTTSPTPTPSSSPSSTPSSTATPDPTPTPPALIPPVLPTPPPIEEPKNLIFVDPKTPTVVPPQSLPEPPASPIVITKQPEFGQVTVAPSGQITYTSALTDPKSTTVDVVEITYTSLSGAVVVVRKEFILAQRGDVPSIIQTGYANSGNPSLIYLGLLTLLGVALDLRMRGRRDEA